MDPYELLDQCIGFDWDEGNSGKSWRKHEASDGECEAVFFNRPLIVAEDAVHSQGEARLYLLGQTDSGRPLFLVFTIREERIRVISARERTPKELEVYSS